MSDNSYVDEDGAVVFLARIGRGWYMPEHRVKLEPVPCSDPESMWENVILKTKDEP